jgi:hypothetical protein
VLDPEAIARMSERVGQRIVDPRGAVVGEVRAVLA